MRHPSTGVWKRTLPKLDIDIAMRSATAVVFTLRGVLDGSAASFMDWLFATAAGAVDDVTIDLADVTRVDGPGGRGLRLCVARARASGQTVHVLRSVREAAATSAVG